MKRKMLSFAVVSFLTTQISGYRIDDNPYKKREVLDPNGKYIVEWEIDLLGKQVTFNVTVQTKGYVGFGLSSKSRMNGADIVIGGVYPDGRAYFSDRHAIGNEMPVEDESQDWDLLSARESGSTTYLTFSRKFDTCDNENDLQLEVHGDVVSMIWAYGESDTDLGYHYQNRGSMVIYLLDPDLIPAAIETAPPFGNFVDGNVSSVGDWNVWTVSRTRMVPEDETAYICTFHKAPVHHKKLHVVGFRSVLPDANSLRHIHHFVLHRCRPPTGLHPDEFFGPWLRSPGELCYILDTPSSTSQMPYHYCQEFVHVWGVGGKPNFYPEHAGLPLTEFSDDEYYMLQVHYDNPEMRRGVQAQFALEVFYTEQIRKHDVGVISAGTAVPGSISIMIPSNSIDYKLYGHCGSACTGAIVPQEGIHIFSVFEHTHLAGRGLRSHQIRNRKELPWIIHDDNYDFNYQQTRTLTRERTVLPGDSIIVECTYDTTDRNGSVTVGGFSTRNEMCSNIIYYYPYIRTGAYGLCSSEIRSETYRKFIGIHNETWSDSAVEHIVTAPSRNAGLTVSEVGDNIEWTSERRRRLSHLQRTLPQVTLCPNQDYNFNRPRDNEFLSVYDENMATYEPPDTCNNIQK